MICNFQFCNYKCTYYAGKRLYNSICFSSGFKEGIYKKSVYITYIFPKDKQEERNYCPFSKEILIEYFKEISKLLGFKILTLSNDENYYKLQIKCAKDNRYFRYISTCIRYVYEYPFAELLYCAWQNKANFPELNIIQIMQFYLALFYNDRYCHCFGWREYCFSNMNAKSQFNILYGNFNETCSLIKISTFYNNLFKIFKKFNTKQLSQLSNSINNIANKYYDKYKKNICRW